MVGGSTVTTEAVRQGVRSGVGKIHKYVDFEIHDRLHNVLKSLMRGTTASHFLKPVDVALVPGYHKIILQPMDLGTVREKLLADLYVPWADKYYLTAEEYAHDVRLVFKNCFLFNAPTHHVFRDGRQKLEKFEKDLETEYRDIERSGPPVPLFARCQLLLIDLRRNPMTEWFRRAEDWQALGDTYLNAINGRQPMDLDKVQSHIDNGQYFTPGRDGASSEDMFDVDAFAEDVRLVWQNALDFNQGEGTAFGVMAKVLQQHFERRLKDVKEAPRAAECQPSRASTKRKRRQELHEACVAVAGNLAVASDVVEAIERACPAAVSRRRADTGAGTEVDVDLDELPDALVDPLLEQVNSVRGGTSGELALG